jgi:para-nitrobenzyl esterase
MTKVSGIRFRPNLDGYFLPKPLKDIFTGGEQSKVPLLAGSNSEEQPARTILGTDEPTRENFEAAVRKLYPDHADKVLKAYAASTPEEVLEAARDLASARFVGHGTWKWTELQMKTGGKPVYRYLYAHPRPKFLAATHHSSGTTDDAIAKQPAPKVPRGAAHSAEIQYAMGNLPLDKRYAWEPADDKVSDVVQRYFVNFIKTGNPNGPGLPKWPPYTSDTNFQIMRLDVDSHAQPETQRKRYLVLDTLSKE